MVKASKSPLKDPTKGVGSYRQQDGGHGSRNPLRNYVQVSGLIKKEEKIPNEVNKRAKAIIGAPQRHFGVEEGIAEQ